jgi:hypothetical protein
MLACVRVGGGWWGDCCLGKSQWECKEPPTLTIYHTATPTHATLFEVAGTSNRIYCELVSDTLMNTLTLTNSKARSIQTPDRIHAAIKAPKYSCDHDLPFLQIVRFATNSRCKRQRLHCRYPTNDEKGGNAAPCDVQQQLPRLHNAVQDGQEYEQ